MNLVNHGEHFTFPTIISKPNFLEATLLFDDNHDGNNTVVAVRPEGIQSSESRDPQTSINTT